MMIDQKLVMMCLVPYSNSDSLNCFPSLLKVLLKGFFFFCWLDAMDAGGVVHLNTNIPLWVNVTSEILL